MDALLFILYQIKQHNPFHSFLNLCVHDSPVVAYASPTAEIVHIHQRPSFFVLHIFVPAAIYQRNHYLIVVYPPL